MNANAAAQTYIEAWNTQDAEVRETLIKEVWSEQGTYTDPLAEAVGRAAFGAVVEAVRAQFPASFVFTLGPVDAHHNLARFTWNLGPAGEEPVVVGFDVAVFDEDGRIAALHGFLDKVPAM